MYPFVSSCFHSAYLFMVFDLSVGYLFLLLNIIPLYECTVICWSMPPRMDSWVFFQFWAIASKTTMDIYKQIFV